MPVILLTYSGSVDGRAGLVCARVLAILQVDFGLRGCCGGQSRACPGHRRVRQELDAGHVYVRFGDGQRVWLVELVDNERGKDDEGSDEEREVGRTIAYSSRYFA